MTIWVRVFASPGSCADPVLSPPARRWLNEAVLLSLDVLVLHRLGYQDYVWESAEEAGIITGADNGGRIERI